ncbi:MAG: hypothetical protein NTX50_27840 [Candidatus Sumerlaeota bacterium]|nr:hypothetical protein [Candidatus Sumerlaeota bacterium]
MSLLRNYRSLLADGWGRAFRQKRTAACLPLPKWRKHARRPSILDLCL